MQTVNGDKLFQKYVKTGYINILSLAGGGCYGYAQALVLDGCNYKDKFDAYAGTSIGGINSLLLSLDNNRKISSFYTEYASSIFSGYPWKKFLPRVPAYSKDQIEEPLYKMFHNIKFKYSLKPILIPSYNIDTGSPKFFWSEDIDDGELTMFQIARATSAAPTYFSPITINNEDYADGGIFCNDPIMAICVQINRDYKIPFEAMRVFNIGTGINKNSNRSSNPRFRTEWISIILTDVVRGNVSMHRHFAKTVLCPSNYNYIDFPRLTNSFDDYKLIDIIPKAWEKEIDDGIKKINKFLS